MDDLVDGMVRMMNSAEGFAGPVNLGNPNEITVKKLAELIVQMTNSKSGIIHMPLPQDDPIQRKPDVELAKDELDWSPVVPLEDGLEKTIKYFRGLL